MTHPLFEGCTRPAEFYRRVIDVENLYSPLEMAEITADLSTIPDPANRLLAATARYMRMGAERPRPYARIRLAERVHLYRAPGGAEPKSLLLCFSGNANRLMIPTAAFLQCVPEDRFDVAIVQDPTRFAYTRGIPGYADDLPSALKRLLDDLGARSHREIRCFGTSAGGAAALYAGLLLSAKRAICVGGLHPTRNRLLRQEKERGRFTGLEWDALTAPRLAGRSTELVAVHAEGHQRDREGAQDLRAHLPGLRIASVRGSDKHAVIAELLMSNALQRFMGLFVLADTLPPASRTQTGECDE
ncbi:MAG: hypothetical protein RIS35_3385 [Pseudomonadota bacterium]|jgi:hypothetical protein